MAETLDVSAMPFSISVPVPFLNSSCGAVQVHIVDVHSESDAELLLYALNEEYEKRPRKRRNSGFQGGTSIVFKKGPKKGLKRAQNDICINYLKSYWVGQPLVPKV